MIFFSFLLAQSDHTGHLELKSASIVPQIVFFKIAKPDKETLKYTHESRK